MSLFFFLRPLARGEGGRFPSPQKARFKTSIRFSSRPLLRSSPSTEKTATHLFLPSLHFIFPCHRPKPVGRPILTFFSPPIKECPAFLAGGVLFGFLRSPHAHTLPWRFFVCSFCETVVWPRPPAPPRGFFSLRVIDPRKCSASSTSPFLLFCRHISPKPLFRTGSEL